MVELDLRPPFGGNNLRWHCVCEWSGGETSSNHDLGTDEAVDIA